LSNSYLHDVESLDSTSVRNVRTSAQIDQGTATVDGGAGAIGNLVLDNVLLVLVVAEHLEQILLLQGETLESLLLLDGLLGDLLQGLPVRLQNRLGVGESHFVVETILDRGTNAQTATESSLASLTQNVSTRVPEDLLSLGVFEIKQFQLAALLQRAVQIPQLSIDLRDDGALEQRLADSTGDLGRGGFPGLANEDFTVGHSNVDVLARLLSNPCVVLSLDSVEDLVAVVDV